MHSFEADKNIIFKAITNWNMMHIRRKRPFEKCDKMLENISNFKRNKCNFLFHERKNDRIAVKNFSIFLCLYQNLWVRIKSRLFFIMFSKNWVNKTLGIREVKLKGKSNAIRLKQGCKNGIQ